MLLPDGSHISPSHQGTPPLCNKLSKTATVIPSLTTSSLLSMGRICDDGNMVIFDKHHVHAVPHTAQLMEHICIQPIILHGRKNHSDGLWDTKLHQCVLERLNIPNVAFPQGHSGMYFHQGGSCIKPRKKNAQQASFSRKTILEKSNKDEKSFDSLLKNLEQSMQEKQNNHFLLRKIWIY